MVGSSALFFLKNNTVIADKPDTIKKTIIGVCSGSISATWGAAIVTILPTNVAAEKLNGTNKGGNDSGAI